MSKEITIEDVCKAAWEATRPASAVPWDELIDSYRAKLIERAEAVLNGVWPSDPWKAFETQVCQLADGRGNMQIGTTETLEDVETARLERAERRAEATKPVKKSAKKSKK